MSEAWHYNVDTDEITIKAFEIELNNLLKKYLNQSRDLSMWFQMIRTMSDSGLTVLSAIRDNEVMSENREEVDGMVKKFLDGQFPYYQSICNSL